MLFGDRQTLALEIAPLVPSWERRYVPERTAWARLSLWVHRRNLCRHVVEDSDEVRDGVNVPLAPVADWLVKVWPWLKFEERAAAFATSEDPFASLRQWGESRPPAGFSENDWIDAREAWWSRHFLAAAAEGAHLPAVALVRQDEGLIVQWKPRLIGAHTRRVPLPEGAVAVPWPEAGRTLASFVAFVADWLRREGEQPYPWVAREDPLAEAEPPFIEGLETFTGRSRAELVTIAGVQAADEVPAALGLSPDTRDPGASPVTQALRDLPGKLTPAAGHLLKELERTTRTAGVATGVDQALVSLRGEAEDAMRDSDSWEEEGYRAAAQVRKSLRLDGAPIDNTKELLDRLGVRVSFEDIRIPGARMITGFRLGGTPAAILLRSERTEVEWGQRFEGVRALGHLLLDRLRDRTLGAASSPFAEGIRRRRSGAFAAEFLLPEAAMVQETGGALDAAADPDVFERLMERFGVGATTGAYHLWNRGFLSSETVRDQLIEDFGA